MPRGDRVGRGDVLGTAGPDLHFGARVDDRYIDPTTLFAQPVSHRARLVPDDGRPPPPQAGESAALVTFMRSQPSPKVLGTVAPPGGGRIRAQTQKGTAPTRGRRRCTAAATPVPRPTARRIAVLVGGLGSATGHASVLSVDTAALGYNPDDVIEFSYRADGKPYGPADTQVDINASGAVLAQTLQRVRGANPGVPIDVIAHSQGGLVARVAINEPDAPHVETIVTLATPHRGANLATAGATIASSARGRALLDEGGHIAHGRTNPLSVSVGQMSANSDFMRDLATKHIPAGTRAVSIGVRGDLVVPSARAHWAGADNTVVDLGHLVDPFDHSRLPASPAARREIGLAIAGLRPTCRSMTAQAIDRAVSSTAERVEDRTGQEVAKRATAHELS